MKYIRCQINENLIFLEDSTCTVEDKRRNSVTNKFHAAILNSRGNIKAVRMSKITQSFTDGTEIIYENVSLNRENISGTTQSRLVFDTQLQGNLTVSASDKSAFYKGVHFTESGLIQGKSPYVYYRGSSNNLTEFELSGRLTSLEDFFPKSFDHPARSTLTDEEREP